MHRARSSNEMGGALMSDMAPEPAERRERRRLFMGGFPSSLAGDQAGTVG